MWCPQWWFIWWHYKWREVGYQFEVPISYETLEEAEFMEDKNIRHDTKFHYSLMKLKTKTKIDRMKSDFE